MMSLLRNIILIGIVTTWWGSEAAFGQAFPARKSEGDITCATKNTSFKGGEHVEFKVYYNWGFVWLSAGKVEFDVMETEDAYKIVATGRSYPSYEWFFKVRDYYETIIDKETMLPRSFKRKINEGDYHVEETIIYDQMGYQVHSTFINSNGNQKSQIFDVDGCVQDILSTIYRLRNVDVGVLQRERVIPFRIFLEDGSYPLNIFYRGEETRDLYDLGRYKALRITPQLLSGNVFKEGDEMFVSVTDDLNRLPIYIESPVSVGSVKVYLTAYRNLRYPLDSKTD